MSALIAGASISACHSFAHLIWQLPGMTSAPNAEWWINEYVRIARDLEIPEEYCPRGGAHSDCQGTLWEFVEKYVAKAYENNLSVLESGRLWYSGAYLLETMPSVLYILMKHGHELEEAIVRAVNDTKDNDTIAAIVGAAVGALHGRRKIPSEWISRLSGRTTNRDDGRIFQLLDQAREIWWKD